MIIQNSCYPAGEVSKVPPNRTTRKQVSITRRKANVFRRRGLPNRGVPSLSLAQNLARAPPPTIRPRRRVKMPMRGQSQDN